MFNQSKLYFFLFFAVSLFQNCKSDTEKTTENPIPQTTAAVKTIEIYAINRNDFRLRDKPDLAAGQKVVSLSYGDFVEFLNEKTDKKTPVQIGDMTYSEAFYKVRSLDSLPKTGWMHGTGLLRIFKGAASEKPSLQPLAEMGALLRTQPVGKLESSQKAMEIAQKILPSCSGSTADALYILLENFLSRTEREGSLYELVDGKINPSDNEWQQIFNGQYDMSKNPILQSLAKGGYRLNTSEGMLFPTVDYQKLSVLFRPKCSPAMQAFLDLTVEADQNRSTEDAGITLPLDELADRAVKWEKFIIANPNFALTSAASDAEWLNFLVVCGSDNTPVFDYETHKPNKEFSELWAYILSKYPNSRLAALVQKRQAAIAAADNTENDAVQGFCADLAQSIW